MQNGVPSGKVLVGALAWVLAEKGVLAGVLARALSPALFRISPSLDSLPGRQDRKFRSVQARQKRGNLLTTRWGKTAPTLLHCKKRAHRNH